MYIVGFVQQVYLLGRKKCPSEMAILNSNLLHGNVTMKQIAIYGSAEGPCEVFKKVFVSPN